MYSEGAVEKINFSVQGVSLQADLLLLPLGPAQMVLGAHWLRSLGPVTMDFGEMTMQFQSEGKWHKLQGILNPQLQCLEVEEFSNISSCVCQAYMIQM